MTTVVSRRTVLLLAAASAALGAVGCMPRDGVTGGSVSIRMACGEPGGTYIRFGKLLAAALEGSEPIGRVSVLQTEGSRQNIELLSTGGAELAIALADAIDSADTGIVAIGRVYLNYVQCIVRSDSEIRTLEDLRGRTVSLGAPGSGTAHTARRLLELDGLNRGDDRVIGIEQNLATAVSGLASKAIDALFWSGGIPLPALDGLPSGIQPRVLDLSTALPKLSELFPGVYHRTAIPAGVYGLLSSLPAIGVSNLLLMRDTTPGNVVRTIVDHLIDDAGSLVPDSSVGVQFLTPANLIDTAGVPLHPEAAARFAYRYG